MDRNTLLFFALSFGIMVLWYGLVAPKPEPAPPAAAPAPGEVARRDDATPSPTGEAAREFEAPGVATTTTSPPLSPSPSPPLNSPDWREQRVAVETDLYRAELSSRGGVLLSFLLKAYSDAYLPGRPRVEMVTTGEAYDQALATPLRGLGFGDLSQLGYEVRRPDAQTVVFTRTHQGVTIRKRYRFSLDDYQLRLRIELENGAGRYLRPGFNTLWPGRAPARAGFSEFGLVAYHDGGLERFVIDPPDMLFGGGGSNTLAEFSGVDWAGAHSRYFLAALIPDNPRDARARFDPVVVEREALLQLKFEEVELPPGARLDRELRIYLGPKLSARLEAIGSNLDQSILRGWIPSLTRLFEQLLEASYTVVPNYGVAILLITILVRLVMAPLVAKQMKSMKKMSALQPAIKEVQAKHPDDREKQSAAMMAVYREHGMSPFSMFSGCLPMLLQLPVFIGFYYALQCAIALRQQPFFGWIDDLSQPEALFSIPGLDIPVRVLPLLMGASMFFQQKFTPSAMDPAQMRIMLWVMPVMFTFLFYQFASGLVLYWFTSTLLGIGQQWLTNRRAD